MSQEAAVSGGGMQGSGDDDNDKKGKEIAEINHPRSPLPMSDGEGCDHDQTAEDASATGKGKATTLDCLASLEAALPMKRGISSHYDGKSKSFGLLSEMESAAGDATELGKKEHPVNKRRRLLISHQLREEELERGTNSTVAQAASLPEHPAHPQDEEDDDVKAGDGGDVKQQEEDGI